MAVREGVVAGTLLALALVSGACRKKGGAGDFSAGRVMADVEALVALGPRLPGSPAIEEARAYITRELEEVGWVVRRQEFDDKTPRGETRFVNLRARFAPEGGGEIDWSRGGGLVLLCSHYDTKLITGVEFIGANDGGASNGVLIEMARVLSGDPELARGVELVFFDGEEAFVDFTAVDGLYGSRHYAKGWRSAPAAEKPAAAFVVDLVGDKQMRIDPPVDSPRGLLSELYKAAEDVGERRKFGLYRSPITDDHIPLNAAGIPALNVIDADFISRGRWHTAGDNLESLSEKNLQVIGEVMLRLLANRAG